MVNRRHEEITIDIIYDYTEKNSAAIDSFEDKIYKLHEKLIQTMDIIASPACGAFDHNGEGI